MASLTVDFVIKLRCGSLEVTALGIHLLNAVLKPESPIEDVEILNPYNDKMFEDDKLSIIDVKARDSKGAWYMIEVQDRIPGELRNRLVFYTAELFSRQMNEATSYGELRPAISICLLTEPPQYPDFGYRRTHQPTGFAIALVIDDGYSKHSRTDCLEISIHSSQRKYFSES